MKRFRPLLNHHLLAVLAVADICGIALGPRLALPVVLVVSVTLIAALLLLAALLRGRYPLPQLLCLLFFFCLGITQGTVASLSPSGPENIYQRIRRPSDVVAVGRLAAMPGYDGITSTIRLQLRGIRLKGSPDFQPSRGTVLLRMRFPWPRQYRPGCLMAIRARLKRPSPDKTPGTFDYPAYLARKGIWITGSVRSPAQLHLIREQTSAWYSLRYFPERLRSRIGTFIDHNTPPKASALYRAILLGDRSRIGAATLEDFKASGVTHLLAISGLHMTVIGGLLFALFYWLLRRWQWAVLHMNLKKCAGLLCLPFLIGYSLLAGLGSPVFRATIMSGIVILAFQADRPRSISNLLALAALLMLALCPEALFTPSFQLSFAAVAAIALCIPILTRLTKRETSQPDRRLLRWSNAANRWLVAGLLVAAAAVLGTAPIVLSVYNRIPLAGPLATLILEPLICLWSLVLGFCSLPFIFFFPQLAQLLLHTGAVGLALALPVARFFASIPGADLWMPAPSPWLIVCYYGAFLVAIRAAVRRSRTSIPFTLPFFIALVVLLVPTLRPTVRRSAPFIARYLDVGQGSATLFELADGKTVLIDGGGSSLSKESVGQRVIAPFLWQRGITRLDMIILTHPDADHYNGVPFLIKHFSPSLLWTSTLTEGTTAYRSLLALAADRGMSVIRPKAGERLMLGTTTLTCVANSRDIGSFADVRNSGLVVEVENRGASFLFPGDIERPIEARLVKRFQPLQSEVLLAAHHGSATSNSPPFLRAVAPKVILVSAGHSYRSSFPAPRLRRYCRKHAIPLWTTADNGTITVTGGGRGKLRIFLYGGGDGEPLRRRPQQLVRVYPATAGVGP